jgi:hypothetical protein
MGYKIYKKDKDNEIHIVVDSKNDGKLRFKKREEVFSFGESFPTRDEPFTEKTYLEWQIGYYIPINKADDNLKNVFKEEENDYFIGANKKKKGANKKKKGAYELSEIIYFSKEISLIRTADLVNLKEEIESYKEFIDTEPIQVENNLKSISLNNIGLTKTIISLPTFYFFNSSDKTTIEVTIKQQQNASGIQPMIYYCIPILAFKDGQEIIDKTSKEKPSLLYVINKDNIQNFINLMKIFGMASERHNHDTVEILKLIIKKGD